MEKLIDLTDFAIAHLRRYLESSREWPRGYNTIFHDTCDIYHYVEQTDRERLMRTLMNTEGELQIKLECDPLSERIDLSRLERELLESVQTWLGLEKDERVGGCLLLNELCFSQGKKAVLSIRTVERIGGDD